MNIDSTTWRSPNHSGRGDALIASIVVHSCEGALPHPRATSLPWLCNPASRVSAHYYVCRDATIFQLVDDAEAAWHAGTAQIAYENIHSIGIECEHRAGQDWPAVQKDALGWLIQRLKAAHKITKVDTHGQVAIRGPYIRKLDPTDWPRPAFLAWLDTLAPSVLHTVTAGPYGAIAQQSRDAHALAARGYGPGERIACDDLQDGYWHTSDEAGFIPSGQVQA